MGFSRSCYVAWVVVGALSALLTVESIVWDLAGGASVLFGFWNTMLTSTAGIGGMAWLGALINIDKDILWESGRIYATAISVCGIYSVLLYIRITEMPLMLASSSLRLSSVLPMVATIPVALIVFSGVCMLRILLLKPEPIIETV